ncbi:MAG: 3-deoxy-D-manno-octulosonic acid transferase [Pseudomonadota bacterium]|nr:3-deoxy-D-manno-octulosonic acid transferase [Pseudomonadota bacterium]
MILLTYRAAATFGKPFINCVIKKRCREGKEDPTRIGERRGRPSQNRPKGSLIWIHAASLGESLSVLPLIGLLNSRFKKCNFLITTGTVTSAKMLSKRLPKNVIHQFVPVDCPQWVDSFLDHWQPSLAMWVESEFWPNLIKLTESRNIPMVLVNGRISPRSLQNWSRFPGTIASLLSGFKLCLAQSHTDMKNLRILGAANVQMLGNLKYASAPLPADTQIVTELKASFADRPAWLAASTHHGEEEFIINTHKKLSDKLPKLLTIIAPRHPIRGELIAELAANQGLTGQLRSRAKALRPNTDIYIADSIGELGVFYRVAPVSFIGGSLIPHGGQNILEAAKLGSAVIFGPFTENFNEITSEMVRTAAAVRIDKPAALVDAVYSLLTDASTRQSQTDMAKKIVLDQIEILENIGDQLLPIVEIAIQEKIHAKT